MKWCIGGGGGGGGGYGIAEVKWPQVFSYNVRRLLNLLKEWPSFAKHSHLCGGGPQK